jgi:hypothetical protein
MVGIASIVVEQIGSIGLCALLVVAAFVLRKPARRWTTYLIVKADASIEEQRLKKAEFQAKRRELRCGSGADERG